MATLGNMKPQLGKTHPFIQSNPRKTGVQLLTMLKWTTWDIPTLIGMVGI